MTLAAFLVFLRALTVLACLLAAQATYKCHGLAERRLALLGFTTMAMTLLISAAVTALNGGNAEWHHISGNLAILTLAVVQLRRVGRHRRENSC